MSLVRSKKPPLLRLPPNHIQSSSTSQQSRGLKLPLPPPIENRSASRLPEVPEERRTDVLLEDLEKKESLGQGSGGKVFKVVHKRTGAIYALKTIHVQKADAAISKQIMREQEISRRSMSPYVVQCYGVFDRGGEISLVLEYMDSGTLAHVLERRKPIPEPYLAKITVDVLKGLVYLHSNRVVHRDIKPSNLLMNSRGEVKIADFGVSTELANTMAQCNSFVGTCAYMSPERFQLDVHGGFNYTADIWSLGLVLLECALGRYPYLSDGQRPDWVTLMCNICNWEIPCSPRETPHMSGEFRELIKVCLHKDPKRRPGAIQLLQHPFIKKYEGVLQNCDLKPLLT